MTPARFGSICGVQVSRRNRIWLGFAAMVVLALAACYLHLVFDAFGCENADTAQLDTVRCDSERSGGWRAAHQLVGLGCLVGVIVGGAWAIRRVRWPPLAGGAVVGLAGLGAMAAIDNVRLPDRPIPRLSDVRLLDAACASPCSQGVRVAFTLDREAEVSLSFAPDGWIAVGGRDYETGVLGRPRTASGSPPDVVGFGAGAHTIAVGGWAVDRPSTRRPLPAGPYALALTPRPQRSGGQQRILGERVELRVAIRPGRG